MELSLKSVLAGAASPRFSFKYGGQVSDDLLNQWTSTVEHQKIDDTREQRVVRYTDAETGLEVRFEGVLYSQSSALEWVVYFKNTGSADTPVIEAIQALDDTLSVDGKETPTLRYSRGGIWAPEAFEPLAQEIHESETIELNPTRTRGMCSLDLPGAGLSSAPYLPFFNLDCGDQGVILAIGWTGQWALGVDRMEDGRVGLRMGMEKTHLKLHPGEEIRTPLALLLPWSGDWIDGQNDFRRFLLEHISPKPSGKRAVVPMFLQSWGTEPSECHETKIRAVVENEIPVEGYWIDGGWQEGNTPWHFKGWTNLVGNWEASKELYPEGLEKIGKAVHDAGLTFQLWFEPTRVHEGTFIHREHPDWLVGPGPGIMKTHYLYDLGNPEALEWIVDHISERIEKFEVDVYWSDFCFDDPLYYWNLGEAADRQGFNEIKWVDGFYKHWDELLRRHPHLLINNCAGGGRTIDLETMKRSLPLWTSDFQANQDPVIVANQCHSFGSFHWLPISLIGVNQPSHDDFRANMRGGMSLRCWLNKEMPSDFPHKWIREALGQYSVVREYYYGDFYPLTDYSLWESDWLAYQMHRPDLGEGMVLAFRRVWCDDMIKAFKLRGLDESAQYVVKNLDSGVEVQLGGGKLMTEGLDVTIEERPSTGLLTYSKV